ncbi:MAG: exodeoxyribonuclease V subunit gamma [Sedimentisphaerales bacterium]|nr:exodeoxyribonuclease V subunit gamma [Sedimentisphaerales bacterium]
MAVQFILGKSGTGKTTLCIDQIIESLVDKKSEKDLIFLVPEQATYQAERAILSDARIAGYSRLHILSFQRLCYMIFGKNLAARPLSAQSRDMIIHRLLCEQKNELKIFSSTASKYGTAVSIGRTICELQNYGKNPQDVEKLIENLKAAGTSDLTCDKLGDINLIFRQYLSFIEGNFLNSDNQLNLAKNAVTNTPFLKDCLLWVDGFAGFTTSELLLLGELLKASCSAKIALCLDPEKKEDDFTSIFYPTQNTLTQLKSLVSEANLKIEKPVILKDPKRFGESKPLAHLEQNIFSFEPVTVVSARDNIKITACAKTRLEVDFVARQICRLIREENFRWRDIAVIASDIDQYRHFIQAVFNDFKIPFFIDRRRDLQQYPAVELITSALTIAADRVTTNDVINFLKSDLVPVTRAEVDNLENYCLAFGVEGSDWLDSQEWNFAPPDDTDFDNKEIEEIRQKATKHLLQFRTLLQSSADITAAQFCDSLFTFLDSLNVREQLADWTKTAFDTGKLDDAQLHQQFFTQFTQLMDDFVYIFCRKASLSGKDTSIPVKQYAAIISSAFSQMTLALIPPALDQVLVGSIERSRHPDLKAVFLIGTTQQQFPTPVYYDSILSENDRKITSDMNFELAKSASAQLIERRYLAYIAFTRPSRYLYITYPIVDEKGSGVQPSFLISQLQALFGDLKEEKYFGSSSTDILNRTDLTSLLASRLGKDNLYPPDDLDAKCKWLLDTASKDYDLAKVKSAIEYKNIAQLENVPAKKIVHTSATRLRSFASCPYRYFAEHILELKERRTCELEPFSLGLFFHKVLELLFSSLKSNGLDLSTAETDLLDKLIDESVEKLLTEDAFLKSFSARNKHNSFIILSSADMLKEAVLEFSQIASAGIFNQMAAEISFGNKSTLGALEIELDKGKKLQVKGKIDRVDVASKADKNYCMIIDYKTSETKINWSFFNAGLDLQLPIYLLAVKNQAIDNNKHLIPLGAFYFPIQALPESAELNQIEKNTDKIRRKPKGIFNGEFFNMLDSKIESGRSPFYSFQITKDNKQFGIYETSSLLTDEHFSKVLSFTENKLKQFAGDILTGNIEVKPYRYTTNTACKYCPYKSLCRFDWQINDYADINKISKSEFFENEVD